MKTTHTRNWKEYNDRLRNRGSLTLWFPENIAELWYVDVPTERKRGRSNTYSDACILALVQLKHFLGLAYRQSEGFARSLVDLLGLDVKVPSHSQQCRRASKLQIDLQSILAKRQRSDDEALHVVIDSTGLKVYGEGEWKVRCHGRAKQRTWRKLHLGIDALNGEILSAVFSGNDLSDGDAFDDLLEGITEPIDQLSADGAYDQHKCYDALEARSEEQEQVIRITIPPRKNAKILQHGNSSDPPLPRDENLRAIRKGSRKKWKEESGYHQRSKAETGVYRFKRTFGQRLSSRNPEAQAVEVLLKCSMLNTLLFAEDFCSKPPG